MRRIGELRSRTEQWHDLDHSLTDLGELIDLAEDDSLEDDFQTELDRLAAIVDEIELDASFSGPLVSGPRFSIRPKGKRQGSKMERWKSMAPMHMATPKPRPVPIGWYGFLHSIPPIAGTRRSRLWKCYRSSKVTTRSI